MPFSLPPKPFRLLVFCPLLATGALFSQTASVVGRVSAAATPLEFATATLRSLADSTRVLDATATDSLGQFTFRQLPVGEFLLKIHAFGYLDARRVFRLDSARQIFVFEKINLVSDEMMLRTVEVAAQKRLVQRTANGILIRAADNLAQASGTATDLLRSTPLVVVDEEGGITLRGKTPLILVNGRNSTLSATARIPASAVESIEIITNPSARYDAEAEGGIIQITLKKSIAAGTNGSVAAGGGFGARGRVSGAALLNHQQGKWNLGLAYDNRFSNRTRMGVAKRTNFALPDVHFLRQNRHDLRLEQTQNLRLNADFQPNPRQHVGLELLGNFNGEDNHETLVSRLENDAQMLQDKNSRQSEEFVRERAAEGAFEFEQKFADPKKSLAFNASSDFGFDRENTDLTTQALDASDAPLGDPYLERTHNYQNSNTSNLRLDFAQPLDPAAMLETGWKSTFRTTDADFLHARNVGGDYLPDPRSSNTFNFDEQIHAAYFMLRKTVGPADAPCWKFDLGLRAEQTQNRGATATNPAAVRNDYLDFFPSASAAFYLNAADFFKISGNRRINRPQLGQLNPFVDITDSLNPHGGNPLLLPERVNALELSFNKEWKGVSLLSNVFFRRANDLIQRFISLDTGGVALVVPQNFGSSDTWGFEEIAAFAPARFWSCTASFSLFRQKINGANVDADALNDYVSWNSKLTQNFQLWRGGKGQLLAVYNSPIATPQGTRVAVYNVDVGVQQKIFGGRGALGLVATDVFNTQKSGFTARNSAFDYRRAFKVDTRAVLLTFTYSFRTEAKEELLENRFSNE